MANCTWEYMVLWNKDPEVSISNILMVTTFTNHNSNFLHVPPLTKNCSSRRQVTRKSVFISVPFRNISGFLCVQVVFPMEQALAYLKCIQNAILQHGKLGWLSRPLANAIIYIYIYNVLLLHWSVFPTDKQGTPVV